MSRPAHRRSRWYRGGNVSLRVICRNLDPVAKFPVPVGGDPLGPLRRRLRHRQVKDMNRLLVLAMDTVRHQAVGRVGYAGDGYGQAEAMGRLSPGTISVISAA